MFKKSRLGTLHPLQALWCCSLLCYNQITHNKLFQGQRTSKRENSNSICQFESQSIYPKWGYCWWSESEWAPCHWWGTWGLLFNRSRGNFMGRCQGTFGLRSWYKAFCLSSYTQGCHTPVGHEMVTGQNSSWSGKSKGILFWVRKKIHILEKTPGKLK